MKLSAGLALTALLLLAVQMWFSDGTEPNVIGLPIGLGPVTLAMILLPIAGLIGWARGSRRYRVAIGVALLGTTLFAFGILFISIGRAGVRPGLSINEAATLAGAFLWLVALILGGSALRTRRSEGQAHRG